MDVGVVGVVESFVGSKRGKGRVSRAARDDRNSFLHCQAVEDNELGVEAEGEREQERAKKKREKRRMYGGCTADVGRRRGSVASSTVNGSQSRHSVRIQSWWITKNREGWSVRSGGADVPRSGQLSLVI